MKRRHGKLDTSRISRLDALEFEWDPYSTYWGKMFLTLVEFHRKNGHCLVSNLTSDDPALVRWAVSVRWRMKKGGLTSQQIGKLDSLGFSWNSLDARWNKMYAALQVYKAEHGHCNFSTEDPKHKQLRGWLALQRQRKKQRKLGLYSSVRGQEVAALNLHGRNFKLQQIVLICKVVKKELFDSRLSHQL